METQNIYDIIEAKEEYVNFTKEELLLIEKELKNIEKKPYFTAQNIHLYTFDEFKSMYDNSRKKAFFEEILIKKRKYDSFDKFDFDSRISNIRSPYLDVLYINVLYNSFFSKTKQAEIPQKVKETEQYKKSLEKFNKYKQKTAERYSKEEAETEQRQKKEKENGVSFFVDKNKFQNLVEKAYKLAPKKSVLPILEKSVRFFSKDKGSKFYFFITDINHNFLIGEDGLEKEIKDFDFVFPLDAVHKLLKELPNQKLEIIIYEYAKEEAVKRKCDYKFVIKTEDGSQYVQNCLEVGTEFVNVPNFDNLEFDNGNVLNKSDLQIITQNITELKGRFGATCILLRDDSVYTTNEIIFSRIKSEDFNFKDSLFLAKETIKKMIEIMPETVLYTIKDNDENSSFFLKIDAYSYAIFRQCDGKAAIERLIDVLQDMTMVKAADFKINANDLKNIPKNVNHLKLNVSPDILKINFFDDFEFGDKKAIGNSHVFIESNYNFTFDISDVSYLKYLPTFKDKSKLPKRLYEDYNLSASVYKPSLIEFSWLKDNFKQYLYFFIPNLEIGDTEMEEDFTNQNTIPKSIKQKNIGTPVIEKNVLKEESKSKSKAPEVNKQKTIAIAKAKAKALRLESESRLRIKNK